MKFDFSSIPGCVVWIETSKAQGAVNKLREIKGTAGDFFCWEDPNEEGEGLVVAYDRTLTAEESAKVEAAIVESRQPPMTDLPG